MIDKMNSQPLKHRGRLLLNNCKPVFQRYLPVTDGLLERLTHKPHHFTGDAFCAAYSLFTMPALDCNMRQALRRSTQKRTNWREMA